VNVTDTLPAGTELYVFRAHKKEWRMVTLRYPLMKGDKRALVNRSDGGNQWLSVSLLHLRPHEAKHVRTDSQTDGD
jgi:hypothetical protein